MSNQDPAGPADSFWATYHALVGRIRLERGDLDSAVAHLRQADGDQPLSRRLMARALARRRQRDELALPDAAGARGTPGRLSER
jgi:hypothetical protein